MNIFQHIAARVTPATVDALEARLIDNGVNFLAAVLILIVGWWLARRLSRWTRIALDRLYYFDPTLKPLVASLVRYGIWAATILAVLERFGVETTSLIALLGAAGIAVGLALQGTLSNVASGVMLLLLRPFKVGDWITISSVNQSGSVREIGLFTTVLISADQAYVSLPNSAVFSSPIINSSREPLSRLNFTISVDASSDIDAGLKIINDTMAADHRILKVPPAVTGVTAVKEYWIELLVRCWVHNAESETVSFDLHKSISEQFRHAGIAIPARRQLAATAPAVSVYEDAPHVTAMRKSG